MNRKGWVLLSESNGDMLTMKHFCFFHVKVSTFYLVLSALTERSKWSSVRTKMCSNSVEVLCSEKNSFLINIAHHYPCVLEQLAPALFTCLSVWLAGPCKRALDEWWWLWMCLSRPPHFHLVSRTLFHLDSQKRGSQTSVLPSLVSRPSLKNLCYKSKIDL